MLNRGYLPTAATRRISSCLTPHERQVRDAILTGRCGPPDSPSWRLVAARVRRPQFEVERVGLRLLSMGLVGAVEVEVIPDRPAREERDEPDPAPREQWMIHARTVGRRLMKRLANEQRARGWEAPRLRWPVYLDGWRPIP